MGQFAIINEVSKTFNLGHVKIVLPLKHASEGAGFKDWKSGLELVE